MPENETIADGDELAFRAKQVWLLVRRLGGEVVISDREWENVPAEPELILARTDGVMRWVARLVSPVPVAASPVAAELDPPEIDGQLPFDSISDEKEADHGQH